MTNSPRIAVRTDFFPHVGQLVSAINLSDRGVEEKICMEFNGNG